MEAADGEKLAAADWSRGLLRSHAVSDHSCLPLCERARVVPFQLQRSGILGHLGLLVFWQCSRWKGNYWDSIDLRGRHFEHRGWTFRGTRPRLRKRALETSLEITKRNAAPLLSGESKCAAVGYRFLQLESKPGDAYALIETANDSSTGVPLHGQTFRAGPGDYVFGPRHLAHSYANQTEAVARAPHNGDSSLQNTAVRQLR